nr:unnamed protein product [Digitaria exilis]
MRRASMNEEAPPPDFPEGGELWHQRCVLDRPATDMADTGDAGGKGELLGAGEKGEVAAGPVVGAGVGDLTALAISRKCSVRLEALDLSFCRELTNEALGLIVESCPSLRILKLFGCTQITDFFLKGHSNTLVKIIGIEGNILDQMDHR